MQELPVQDILKKALIQLNSVKVEGKTNMKTFVSGIELVETAFTAIVNAKTKKEEKAHAEHHDEQRDDAQHPVHGHDSQVSEAAGDCAD